MTLFDRSLLGGFLICITLPALPQNPLGKLDSTLSNVPLTLQSTVKPGGLVLYNTRTKKYDYEGRSAAAATMVPLQRDISVPNTKMTATREGDLSLSFLGYRPSINFKISTILTVDQASMEESQFDVEARPKPLDSIVYKDKETIDTAVEWTEWKNWVAYIIQSTYSTKSLNVTVTDSSQVKLSNGDPLPDCATAPIAPQTDTKEDVKNKPVDDSPEGKAKTLAAAQKTKLADTAKAEKPAVPVTIPTTVSVAAKGCRLNSTTVQFSTDKPVVVAMKLVKLIWDPSKPFSFDYEPTQVNFQ